MNRGRDDVGMGDGKGGWGAEGLRYFNSQGLTRFLLHEAPRSIDYFSPVS